MHPESTASVTAEPCAVLEGVSIPQCLAESAAEAASARAGVGGGRVRLGSSCIFSRSAKDLSRYLSSSPLRISHIEFQYPP